MLGWIKLALSPSGSITKRIPASLQSLGTSQIFPTLTFTNQLSCTLIQEETHELIIVGCQFQSFVDRLFNLRVEHILNTIQMHITLSRSSSLGNVV